MPRVDPHLAVAFQSHAFKPPTPPGDEGAPADPAALQAFEAKVAAGAGERGTVRARRGQAHGGLGQEGVSARGRPAGLRDRRGAAAGSVAPRVPRRRRARRSRATPLPGKVQEYTVQLEPALFVDGPRCRRACDPDDYNPLQLRGRVAVRALRRAMKVVDVTDPAHPVPLAAAARRPAAEEDEPEGGGPLRSRLERHARRRRVHPAAGPRTYAVTVDAGATAADGQTLGYTWTGSVENWHQRAFTSFGDGHGVWETAGGPQLPFYARNFATVSQWLAPLAPSTT